MKTEESLFPPLNGELPGGLGKKKTDTEGLSTGLGPRLFIKRSPPQFRKDELSAEAGEGKYRSDNRRGETTRAGQHVVQQVQSTRVAQGKEASGSLRLLLVPGFIPLTLVSIPRQPSAVAIRTQSLCQRGPMHPKKRLLSPVRFLQRTTRNPPEAVGGRLGVQEGSAPSLAGVKHLR